MDLNSSPWRPTPLVGVSIGLHAAVLVLLAWQPAWWLGLLALIVANHALLTVCGLLPRNRWLGPNVTRLPAAAAARGEIALTIDDGPDPAVTPAVLDILDRYQAHATFFCIGWRAQSHAALCREIVRRGHAVENHSHRHSHGFAFMGPGGFRRELQQAQDTLAAITGRRPAFFRAPAGVRSPLLDPVLHDLNLRLASWTRRGFDTRVGDPEVLLQRLAGDLNAGDILLLHDGNAALTPCGQPAILQVLPRLLERAAAAGLRTVTLRAACATLLQKSFIDALINRAAAPYRAAGQYAWRFARGKLAGDPAFAALLSSGLLSGRKHVLDIGSGQGLLAAWLLAAREAAEHGHWPADWPTAPAPETVRGIELMQHDVDRAGRALHAAVESGFASFVAADMRQADFARADAVVILDVLHYVPFADQDEILRRVRAALDPGGVLLLRIGDQAGGIRFKVSYWVDALLITLRGHSLSRLYCRTLAQWQEALGSLGFAVQVEPMSEGTPFANVMLVARL